MFQHGLNNIYILPVRESVQQTRATRLIRSHFAYVALNNEESVLVKIKGHLWTRFYSNRKLGHK